MLFKQLKSIRLNHANVSVVVYGQNKGSSRLEYRIRCLLDSSANCRFSSHSFILQKQFLILGWGRQNQIKASFGIDSSLPPSIYRCCLLTCSCQPCRKGETNFLSLPGKLHRFSHHRSSLVLIYISHFPFYDVKSLNSARF